MRPRQRNPSYDAIRKREQRDRRAAGLKCLWLEVDLARARRRWPHAGEGELRVRLEALIEDALVDSSDWGHTD